MVRAYMILYGFNITVVEMECFFVYFNKKRDKSIKEDEGVFLNVNIILQQTWDDRWKANG
jgi:hypothetical protein